MAITLIGTATAAGNSGPSTLSVSYTVANSGTLIVLDAADMSVTADTAAPSFTWDSSAATPFKSNALLIGADNRRGAAIAYVIASVSGAQTAEVTWPSTCYRRRLHVVEYSGASGMASSQAAQASAAGAASAAITISSWGASDLGHAILHAGTSAGTATGAGVIIDAKTGTTSVWSLSKLAPVDGSTTMTMGPTSAAYWVMVGGIILASAAPVVTSSGGTVSWWW